MESVTIGKGITFYSVVKERVVKHCRNYWKELKARSLNTPSILLLVYATSIPVCNKTLLTIADDISTPLDSPCYSNPHDNLVAYSAGTLILNALGFVIPFCGWLSDTKIGRGKAIYLSLWLGWIGTLLRSIGCCFQYNSCGIIALIGRYALSSIALVFLFISLAFMSTNILAYGVDQMMNVSSVKIRAFIHWIVWEYFFFGSVATYADSLPTTEYEKGTLGIAVIGFTLVSISLCLHFHLQHRFEHIPIPNPYKIVFKVLKYSIQNNHNRRQRSAFTYWGKEPSRIDLAKERYGGSFTHEEVENVKTFLRIVAVLITLFPLFTVTNPFIYGISRLVQQFEGGYNGLQRYNIRFIGYSGLLVLIPLLELVILPLFPKLEYFLINPLRGLGLANILILLSIVSVFLVDLIGRVTNKPFDIPCFTVWGPSDSAIQTSYWVLLLPSLLAGTSLIITWIHMFEFLCSQAPFGMHGMIIGFFWFLRNIFFDIGSGITLLFQYFSFSSSSLFSCTSWFTIIFGFVGLVGLVVYVLTARWYVKRIRDTDIGLRTVIEEQWEQRLIRENSFINGKINDGNTVCDNVVILDE